ncbi:MAG: hypothetical protein ACRD7E_13940 [Bryobacteraceae bacterium]
MNTNSTFMVIVGTVKKSRDTILIEMVMKKGFLRLSGLLRYYALTA